MKLGCVPQQKTHAILLGKHLIILQGLIQTKRPRTKEEDHISNKIAIISQSSSLVFDIPDDGIDPYIIIDYIYIYTFSLAVYIYIYIYIYITYY